MPVPEGRSPEDQATITTAVAGYMKAAAPLYNAALEATREGSDARAQVYAALAAFNVASAQLVVTAAQQGVIVYTRPDQRD